MLRIRKVKTKSGKRSVQVVSYTDRRTKIIKHIGSCTEEELPYLMEIAREYIRGTDQQERLFPEPKQKIINIDTIECISVTHEFALRFLERCAKECGLSEINRLLLDLSIIRLIEPTSKLRSIKLLNQYFGIKYSERIYRKIPKLGDYKSEIEQIAYRIATERLDEELYFVLYDVTTLFFESNNKDELRLPGFSKDNKPQQPQIVVGLLVTQRGFPLIYEIFPGNTFEGKTMLPVIERFLEKHKGIKPIIVADAAMLSEYQLEELKQKQISYIVGARLSNCSIELIKEIEENIKKEDASIFRIPSRYGYLVCDFSTKRYKKQLHDLIQQINKAEHMVLRNSVGRATKFVKRLTKEKVGLNESLIEKHKLLLGIKGYCTNIPENIFSNDKIIASYHNLWRVEQSFRMSKSDLQTRPIFHYKQDAIKSHILICFIALIMEKYLELTTKLSLRTIRDLIWNITSIKIQDKLTKNIFSLSSPNDELMSSPLANLIRLWNISTH